MMYRGYPTAPIRVAVTTTETVYPDGSRTVTTSTVNGRQTWPSTGFPTHETPVPYTSESLITTTTMPPPTAPPALVAEEYYHPPETTTTTPSAPPEDELFDIPFATAEPIHGGSSTETSALMESWPIPKR
jgi:hypothetical protein